ncbi:MAG: ferredoxin--NADP reductase [Candidatus Krumholzibacteriia bacterium]
MNNDAYNATIVSRQDIDSDLAIVRVKPDSGEVAGFLPGQYALVGLPKRGAEHALGKPHLVRRPYSVASSPAERDVMEFYIVRVREGRLTPGLFDVPEGGRVWLDSRARGRFTLEGVPADIDLVLVATGTGVAPYVSMLRTHRGQGRWRRFILIHGARRERDLGYREEIETARREDPSILYLPTVTREPADSLWPGLRGRVQDVLQPAAFRELTGTDLRPDRCYVFLCGHPEMIQSTSAELAARGFELRSHESAGSMQYEKYW